MSLYGDVTINGDTDSSGYTLTAIDQSGTELGRIEVTDGSYGGSGPYEAKLDVECGCNDGEIIRFVISGTQAGQTVAFGSGNVEQQDLTFTGVTTPTPSTDDSSAGSGGSAGGGGGGSAGGGGGGSSPPPTDTPAEDDSSVVETVPIEDDNAQASGTNVEVNESDVVQEVTFNGDVNGVMEISEIDVDTDDRDEIETQFDEAENAAPEIVAAVDISPDSEEVAETSATIQLSVPRSDVDNPASVFVVHQTEDSWERLDMVERQVSDETVTLVAEAESFSPFAAVEIEGTATPTTQTTDDASTSSTTAVDTVSPDGTQQPETTPDGEAGGFGLLPVFGLVAAVLGVTAGVVILRRSDL
jgi:hypothetical protein